MIIHDAAQALYDACKECTPIEQPITSQMPGLTLDEAYVIQRTVAEYRQADGEDIIGWKIGLTNPDVLKKMGAKEPFFAPLLTKMYYLEGTPVPAESMIMPRIEGELAFCMKRELYGPNVTIADVYDAVEYVAPAIEIPDGRIKGGTILDVIADGGNAGGIVIGGRMTPLKDVDMRLCGMTLEKNGTLLGTATTAVVYGSPAQAMIWLANALAQHDMALRPGDVVLTGALVGPIPASKGDTFTATFYGMGSVSVTFA